MGAGRQGSGRPYRRLAAGQRALGLPCWICGRPIRYDLPAGHPLSFSYDHYAPASRWAEFGYPDQRSCVLDPANGRSAHLACNKRRQAVMPYERGWRGVEAGIAKSPPAPPSKPSHAV